MTGVDPKDLREAARQFATGGNWRDLLRPRRHRAQPGLDHGDRDRQPRDGDRQYRPSRRRREPAARPEQRSRLLRHGLVPARAARLSPYLGRRGARPVRGDVERQAQPEPGLRIPNMFDAAIEGTFMGIYVQGEDILQSDPNTKHVVAALSSMECVIVHDLFLNETANYAHVFLPGSTFLEKDGTFTNAERPHPARPQGDDAAQRPCRLGSHHRPCQGDGL
jgi:formate dehydrogenase major subunit